MKSLENCKEYTILAEHEDDSSFIMEHEHKNKGIFSPHTYTEFQGTIWEDTLPDERCLQHRENSGWREYLHSKTEVTPF